MARLRTLAYRFAVGWALIVTMVGYALAQTAVAGYTRARRALR
jgi:hypothetical protein